MKNLKIGHRAKYEDIAHLVLKIQFLMSSTIKKSAFSLCLIRAKWRQHLK